MGRWGLRWIFCWLSVLVTACTQLASPTPAEKTQNRTPIQGFTPPSTASPTEPVRPAYTLTPLGSTTPSSQTDQDEDNDFRLAPIMCYESPAQSLICLGWIENVGDTPITNVLIDVYLLTPQGIPIETKQVIPALSVLSPQSGSPFRAIFQEIPTSEWSAYGELRQSETIPIDLPQNMMISIVVEGLHTEWTDQSYAVSGSVVNDRTVSLTRVQLIITVRGELETVTGFRVIDLLDENHELLPDERLPFSVRITPLDGETGQGVIVEAHGSAAIQ
jgi:hypothetical protein